MESVLNRNNNTPVGFTITNSPFEKLRDSCSDYFYTHPSVCYGDITEGLVFLKPLKQLKSCKWLKEYISDKMFMQYKAYYELVAKRKFKNAKEVNQYFEKESTGIK